MIKNKSLEYIAHFSFNRLYGKFFIRNLQMVAYHLIPTLKLTS